MKKYSVVVDSEILIDEFFSQYKFIEVFRVGYREITNTFLKKVSADALFIRSVTKVNSQLLSETTVSFIGTATSGEDHIDHNYCKENGIELANAKGSNAIAVCEYVLICLEIAKRNVGTIGIIGFGEIGSRLSSILSNKGYSVLINDPYKRNEIESTTDFQYLSLEELLENSEIVTIHIPFHLGEFPTYNLLSKTNRSNIENGSMLIHSSRGGIVEEEVYFSSKSASNLELFVDVWENEPTIQTKYVDRTTISTPHIAGYTYTAKKNAATMICTRLLENLVKECDQKSQFSKEQEHSKVKNASQRKENRTNQFIEISQQFKKVAINQPSEIAIEFDKIRTSIELLPEFLEEPFFIKR